MRIAVNASIVDPVPTGLGSYIVNVLKELARLHDDLVVYTSYPEVCGLNSTRSRRISRRFQAACGRVGSLTRITWIQTFLPLRLVADRASLLLSPLHEGMLLPLVPQAVIVHDLIPLYFPEGHTWLRLYFRYFLPIILHKSCAILTVSENTKKDIVAAYRIEPDRVYVVPNGVDLSRYRVGINATRVKCKYKLEAYVLYVGRMLPYKNLPGLLDAFSLISTKVPHQLVIAGPKDRRYYPDLEAKARALGLEERILFLDYIPVEELPALFTGADALVLPSLYEGFGLPVLEAMACGTPVITSCVASLAEVTGDAAVLIDPHNPRELANAIETVLSDPVMRDAMRRRGVAQAARFSWTRTALMILEILRDKRLP